MCFTLCYISEVYLPSTLYLLPCLLNEKLTWYVGESANLLWWCNVYTSAVGSLSSALFFIFRQWHGGSGGIGGAVAALVSRVWRENQVQSVTLLWYYCLIQFSSIFSHSTFPLRFHFRVWPTCKHNGANVESIRAFSDGQAGKASKQANGQMCVT